MNYAPLYIQIADQLRNDILNGTYPLGSLMPTEIQLEELFRVSKITIRNAVKILADEGYVTKRSGLGTRVVRDTVRSKLEEVASFSQIFSTENFTTIKNSEVEVVEINESHPFYQIFGNRYMKLVKRYYLDNILIGSFVYAFEYQELTENDRKQLGLLSLRQFFAAKTKSQVRIKDIFEVIYMDEDPEAREVFDRDIDILLRRTRTVLNDENRIVGFHTGYIDTRTYPYVSEFEA